MKNPLSIVIPPFTARFLDRRPNRQVTLVLPAISETKIRAGWDVRMHDQPAYGFEVDTPMLGTITSKHPLRDKFGVFIRHPSLGLYLVPSPAGGVGAVLSAKEETYNVEDSGWLGPVFVESKDGRLSAEWGHGDNDDRDHIEPYDLKTRSAKRMKASDARFELTVQSVSIKRLGDLAKADTVHTGITPSRSEGLQFIDYWREAFPGDAQPDAYVWVIRCQSRSVKKSVEGESL